MSAPADEGESDVEVRELCQGPATCVSKDMKFLPSTRAACLAPRLTTPS